MLEKEYAYFKAHKVELLEKYRGRFIVIKAESVLGDFATQEDAIAAALKDNLPGTFMVQECSEGSDQVMRFHSRVTFAQHAEA
ncbi:MAG: hypothetical protein IMZ69_09520 [Spirochaetes bacterium]|nr:hypothetical protein [Spirochaetota bacterium]